MITISGRVITLGCVRAQTNLSQIQMACKHMFWLDMTEQIALPPATDPDAARDVVVYEMDTSQCANCGSSDTGPHGTRSNKNYSVKRR